MLNQWFSDNISAYILLFYKRCPFTLRKGTFYNAKDVKSCAKRYAFANQLLMKRKAKQMQISKAK